MHIVTLIPKTKRGKQIVQSYGDRWEVIRKQDKVLFSDMSGPWFLIAPIDEQRVATTIREAREESASRWVHSLFDDVFVIAP